MRTLTRASVLEAPASTDWSDAPRLVPARKADYRRRPTTLAMVRICPTNSLN
jgi:hypothetical protein